jgi:hypothetical protein
MTSNYLANQQQVLLVFAVPFTSLSILCNKQKCRAKTKTQSAEPNLAFF